MTTQQNKELRNALEAMKQLATHQEQTIQTLKTKIAQQQNELQTLHTHIKTRTPQHLRQTIKTLNQPPQEK